MRGALAILTCLLVAIGIDSLTEADGAADLAAPVAASESLLAQLQQMSLQSRGVVREAEARLAESPFLCQGRLTLASGTPVPTTDLANQSTLYFTPYEGSRVALYTGTVWAIYSFTERSLALAGLTAATNYDVFLFDNSGTLTLELTAWATDTTRATTLTKTNGVYLRTGALTRRYLGTIRATAANQTQDTLTQRFVWNYFNRVRRLFALSETTDSWTYNAAAFQSTNANAANDLEYVVGESEVPVFFRGMVIATSDATNRTNIATSFGLDSTTTTMADVARGGAARDTLRQQMWAQTLDLNNGLGYHSVEWIEYGNALGVITFYGDDAGDARVQSGVTGYLDG